MRVSGVAVVPADLRAVTRVVTARHYLHRGRTMAQMAYWITVDGRKRGCLLYAYPRVSERIDGYPPLRLLELARVWLNPTEQGVTLVDSLGQEHAPPTLSRAIGASLRRVRSDWQVKYPLHRPALAVIAWSDDEHHEGTIYRAANFQERGKSGGALHGNAHRRNGGHDQLHEDYRHPKTRFLYPFAPPPDVSSAEHAPNHGGRRSRTTK